MPSPVGLPCEIDFRTVDAACFAVPGPAHAQRNSDQQPYMAHVFYVCMQAVDQRDDQGAGNASQWEPDCRCQSGGEQKRKSGERREETTFVDIDAWGKPAEFCSQYLKKGKRIYLEGDLRYNQWEASDGSKRSKLFVHAFQYKCADSNPANDQAADPARANGPTPHPRDRDSWGPR